MLSYQKGKTAAYHVHEDELDPGGNATNKKKNGDAMCKLEPREYGTALAMQRTTMAYVRTAVSVAGLGRTSSHARLQYLCDFATVCILLLGVVQHWSYGSTLFRPAQGEREEVLMRALWSQGRFFHYMLLLAAILVGAVAYLAAYVNVDDLPGPIPFILAMN